MDVLPVPVCIENVSDVEKRLLCHVIPYLQIIKMSNRFSQQWFEGQVVLFAQDVEIAEQLPLPLNRSGIIIVTENLENICKRHFQIDMTKLRAALDWLVENNPTYKDVHTAFPSNK